MNKIEYEKKINALFEKWKQARPEYEVEGKRFTIDGIADYDAWEKSKPKILFLLKENHDEEYEPCWGITVDSKPWSLNIARWRQILIELFRDISKEISFEIVDLPETIDDIAMVEVKKLNEGKKVSSNSDIMKYAKRDNKFLKEQIDLINPQVVLCGNTGDFYDIIYADDSSCKESERLSPDLSKCACWKYHDRLIIDFYHPSTRSDARARELFEILCKIIKEENVFANFDWGKK